MTLSFILSAPHSSHQLLAPHFECLISIKIVCLYKIICRCCFAPNVLFYKVRDDSRVIRSCGTEEHEEGRECYSTVLEVRQGVQQHCSRGKAGSATALFSTKSNFFFPGPKIYEDNYYLFIRGRLLKCPGFKISLIK